MIVALLSTHISTSLTTNVSNRLALFTLVYMLYIYIYIYIYIYNLYIYTMVIAQPEELKCCEVVAYISDILLGQKWRHFTKHFRQRFVCCTLTIVYSIYNTVGRSIASIYDLGGIFTSALRASVNMSPRVVYIGYRPPYRTIYIT